MVLYFTENTDQEVVAPIPAAAETEKREKSKEKVIQLTVPLMQKQTGRKGEKRSRETIAVIGVKIIPKIEKRRNTTKNVKSVYQKVTLMNLTREKSPLQNNAKRKNTLKNQSIKERKNIRKEIIPFLITLRHKVQKLICSM